MNSLFSFAVVACSVIPGTLAAQTDLVVLTPDQHRMEAVEESDPIPELNRYDRFNPQAGGDSTRSCALGPCSGWVEDHYADGTLKHRGMYSEGALVVYRNYYPNGVLEREFKQQDAIKSVMRTYFSNATLRSEARYADGVVFKYEDHYVNGGLRYAEERHRKEPYYLRMDLYSPTGEPLSLLRLVDRKLTEFELREYYPGGLVRSEGRARYDKRRMDTQRVGTWRHYDTDGSLLREEDHVDGKVHTVR
ncbi:MAG: hypothetical protein WEC15_03660 [Flavobacteriales bacterium]